MRQQVVCAVLVLLWQSFVRAETLVSFKEIERCDENGHVKEQFEGDPGNGGSETDCFIGYEIPNAALAKAAEVRIYAYDFGSRFSQFRSDLMPSEGLLIAGKMRTQIHDLLPSVAWTQYATGCFDPHHAMAWFDQRGALIASADICFNCNGFQLQLGMPEYRLAKNGDVTRSSIDLDFKQLEQIFRSNGVPMSLQQACAGSAKGEWAESVNALCKLETLRKKLSLSEGAQKHDEESEYIHRCVQLPNRIQF